MKKKIIAVLCSIIMVIPLVFSSPKAAGSSYNGYGTFSKGSYTYSFSTIIEQTEIGINLGTEGVGLNIPWATGSSFTINFQFNDTYSGTVRFTLNSNTGVGYRLADCLWAADGGYFVSSELPSLTTTSTSKTFYIHVYNSQSVSFTLVSSNVNSFHPTSTQYTGFGVSSFYIDLNDSPDITDVYHDMDLYLPGMSTSLQNISSNTATMASDIAILKGYLDGVENLISGLSDNNFGALTYSLNNGTALVSQNPYNNYLYTSSTFTAINVNRFDIQWGSDSQRDNYLVLHFWFRTNIALTNPFDNARFVFRIPPNYNWTSPNVKVFKQSKSSYGTYVSTITLYIPITEMIGFSTASTFSLTVDQLNLTGVTCTGLIYGGYVSSLPYDDQYLSLLQSINNGISTLNGNYDTSQYDQYEQTIDGLNDNMRDRFNSSETSFQNNLNNILTPDQTSGGSNTIFEQFHFDVINGVFTDFLGQLFNAAPVLQYLLLFGLLLLVLGVFI